MALEQLKRLKAVAFYANLFIKSSKQTQVQEVARSFDLEIRIKWPRYHEELQGIADGSKRGILDIVAIIARPEIAFGLFSDGYTSLFWDTPGTIFLVQNQDICPSTTLTQQKVSRANLTVVDGRAESKYHNPLNLARLDSNYQNGDRRRHS